jgi:hypothetical protein
MNKTKPVLARLKTSKQKKLTKTFSKNDKIFEKKAKSQGW